MGTEQEIKVAFKIKEGTYGPFNKYIGKTTMWGKKMKLELYVRLYTKICSTK